MESVEALVAHILALSERPEEVSHLHSLLKQADDSLQAQAANLSPFLGQLDPSKHSLGYLFLLEAYSCGPSVSEQGDEFLQCTVGFIDSCVAEQIRLAPDKFVSVCKRLRDKVVQLQDPIRGVAPLRTAFQKLQPSREHLTALHPEFLLLCLLSKCYKTSLSALEQEIFEVDQPKDFFLFCYYGGMLNIGLKRLHKALEMLHNVITAPMVHLNAIAVEAYKKYILVSLIINGQIPQFPKYTSPTAARNLKAHTQLYVELANTFNSGKYSEVEQFIQSNVERFHQDNNLGLGKQVLASMHKRNIQRLTQTYLTLSLQDIASAVQLETSREAEMHILRMIQGREIYATINQKDGMVSFHEDPEQYKSLKMIECIDASIRRIMELSRKLKAMDDDTSCDPLYLAKAGRERATRYDFDDFDSVPHKFL